MTIERIGYGFGQKRLPWPNCLRVCLGRSLNIYGTDDSDETADTDWVTVIETNIDNMTGELLGGLMDSLLTAGALDVNYTPISMKKNRPATRITVICSSEMGDTLAQMLLRETSTLGVRIQQMQRLKAQRTQQQVETPLGAITIKIKRLGTHILSAAPEYEECQRLAQQYHMPLSEVYELAQRSIETIIRNKAM